MNQYIKNWKYTFFLISCQIFLSAALHAQSYEEGRSAYINGDYSTAMNILSPMAEAGDAEAQKMLGIMYDYGQGVDEDPNTALQWYIRSAEQGQTAVQYQVGAKYFKGETIPQDYNEAARWWQMAADGGQVDAQFNLGLMYFRGMGITQDDVTAAGMFQQAAEQGHGNAQYSLGVMFAFGRGVDRDYQIAREWFVQAADKGVAQAQYNLGIFYENGNGVEQNIEQAKNWYQLAADQGLNEAIAKLDSLNVTGSNYEMQDVISTDSNDNLESSATVSSTSSYDYAEIATTGVKRESWLRDQSPDYYTIQIGSVLNEDDLVSYLKRHNIENNYAYIQVDINGTTRYNAFYGIFGTYQDAQSAVNELPGEIQRSSPWIRNIRILQDMIN